MIYFLTAHQVFWHSTVCYNTADRIQTNTELYPRGIKFLSDYMHEKGLKIGMYSSAGRYILFLISNSNIYVYYEATLFLNMNNHTCFVCSEHKGTLVLAIYLDH